MSKNAININPWKTYWVLLYGFSIVDGQACSLGQRRMTGTPDGEDHQRPPIHRRAAGAWWIWFPSFDPIKQICIYILWIILYTHHNHYIYIIYIYIGTVRVILLDLDGKYGLNMFLSPESTGFRPNFDPMAGPDGCVHQGSCYKLWKITMFHA